MDTNYERFRYQSPIRYELDTPFLTGTAARKMMQHIPAGTDVVVICIGTDRSTGDSLGPLSGTLMKERFLKHIHVYGTLDDPIHGTNLAEKLLQIQTKHPHAFIIAIDACLGHAKHIGTLLIGEGALKPGAAMQKDLPPTGDLFIAGIVNVGGMMEFAVLQSTRLNLVMQLAKQISNIIKRVDFRIDKERIESGEKSSNVIILNTREPLNRPKNLQ
ncbi:spore protease YyaC [Salisediminibacterium halotolerans]|uniref:Sporulation protein YyaC n=1 Tax=Salisediminibacterium halotolerans TaxID=517425 RepID=A0A1H9VIU4_9BACI|nr:spore protease YyaC [Salisediminibacterium haloalkalitolerans]SES21635.1 putative sporulation protein YyaC [Salisediminibacterium haloalkalitolerans]